MGDFKTADAASYASLAEAFARFSLITTQPLARAVVDEAALQPGERVLDIGTGSGIVAIEAAGRLGANGRIVGVDLSRQMLTQAARHARSAPGHDRIALAETDAEHLPFAAATFDCVVSLFALLHFPNPSQALAEMRRVLKPGGRLVLGIGSRPPLTSWKGLRHYASRVPDAIAERTGRLLVAPAFLEGVVAGVIPEQHDQEETDLASNRATRVPETLRLVRDAGFIGLRPDWSAHQIAFDDIDQFWELQRTYSSIARKRLNLATPAQEAEVRRRFTSECRAVLGRGGRLVYHYAAFLIAARLADSRHQ
ncbi:MAG: methyltransferase domain-containing protein [Acidobacteriota bacterium]